VFQSPGEVAFSVAGMPVYYYGIILAIAVFCGVCVSSYIYSKLYDKSGGEKIIDFAPFLIFAGIVGARLYYCAVNYSYYISHPLQIFDIRQGGLSIHGMILAGIAALYFCVKKYNLDFFKTIDAMACGTALAQSIGRWGNFFNSEAFGVPCDLPWKLYIPPSHRPFSFTNYEYFHPTFLYESILDLIIFGILLIIIYKCKRYSGLVFGIYLFLYSFVRIGVEYLRIDSVLNILGLPIAQWASVIIIIFTLFYIPFIIYKDNRS